VGIIGGRLGYKLLHYLASVSPGNEISTAYVGKSKIETLFGSGIWRELAGKTVLDFGCESGAESIEIAQHTDARIIGLDINKEALEHARKRAMNAGVSDRCRFVSELDQKVDIIMTLDAFEHFADPAATLKLMRRLLSDDGRIIACFGPMWFHPYGGHMFSFFPYSHLLFTEKALLRWYNEKWGRNAQRFQEVSGGLNQLTISRFERIVANSDFRFDSFTAVPIRKLRPVANRLTREFTTAVVRCVLTPR
jgi:SAM-dependent methyltransferase